MNTKNLKSPCRFLLPLFYNDGRPVEDEKRVLIFSVLNRQFGGWHIVGGMPTSGANGSWFGQDEPMVTIEVAVEPSRIDLLRAVVECIGRELGQEVMYFDAPAPTVEFIRIEGAGSSKKKDAKSEKGAS